MTSPRRLFLVALLALASGAAIAERFVIGPQRADLAAAEALLARAEAGLHAARARLAALARAEQAADRELAAQRAQLAALEGAPPKLWAARIRLLQQLIVELPAQRIPELRLLDTLDWIEIARKAELDTAAKIRTALATARAVARKKFAKHLQDALRQFTAQSQGELPDHLAQLAPFLSPPADAEMLARYALTRTGKLGDEDEHVINETASSDLALSVSLIGWQLHMASGASSALAAPGESDLDAMVRAASVIGSALGTSEVIEPELAGNLMSGLKTIAQTYGPLLESVFDDSFGEELKAAVGRFQAAQPGQTPTNFAQLIPHFGQTEKLMTGLRPALAHLQYLVEHEFRSPASPADLQPYLERPFDPKLLEQLKVTLEGDSVSMNFSFNSNTTTVSSSPPTSPKSP